jgi:hypothetical protein
VFSRPSVKTIATYLVCRLMVGVVADQTRVRRSRVGHGCLLDHAFQDMDVNRTFQDLDLLVDGRRRRRRNFLFSGIRVLLCTVRVLCRYSVLYDISYTVYYIMYVYVRLDRAVSSLRLRIDGLLKLK